MTGAPSTPCWLQDISPAAVSTVGSFVVAQSQLTAGGFPVPLTGVVPATSLQNLITAAKISTQLSHDLTAGGKKNLTNKRVATASKNAVSTLTRTKIPGTDQKNLGQLFDLLLSQATTDGKVVTVQATPFALATTKSVPHLNLPILHVTTKAAFIAAVHKIYISLFSAANLHQLLNQGIHPLECGLALLVRLPIATEKSGRLTLNSDSVTIEAIFGESEPLLNNHLNGDTYQVHLPSLTVVQRDIIKQTWQQLSRNGKANHRVITRLNQSIQKLAENEITGIAQYAQGLKKLTGQAQFTWVIDQQHRFWLTGSIETAPITETNLDTTLKPILTGKPIFPGVVSSIVRHASDPKLNKTLQPGDILIVGHSHHKKLPNLEELSGLIIEAAQPHDSLVKTAQTLGIPTIIGAAQATHQLKAGTIITLDATTGAVYKGATEPNRTATDHGHCATCAAPAGLITGTKLYATLNDLQDLRTTSSQTDGFIVLSSRHIWQQLNLHPHAYLKTDQTKQLTIELAEIIKRAATEIYPRPFIYCLDDADSTAHAESIRQHTPSLRRNETESNPALGYRGAIRHLREPEILKAELEALRILHDDHQLTNIHLGLSYIRTYDEFIALRHLIIGSGLLSGGNAQIWLLCQLPATSYLMEKFCHEGELDGIIIDTDSLATHLLGVDFTNPQLTGDYGTHDEAVTLAVQHITTVCRDHGVPTILLNHSGVYDPQTLHFLVTTGVTGLSAPLADLDNLRRSVAATEQRVLLDHAINEVHAETDEHSH